MNRLHQWVNTALLLVAITFAVLAWNADRSQSYRCIKPQEAVRAVIDVPDGYCIAVAPIASTD